MTDIAESFVVKVCGITNEEDASAAIEAGANALGFNFYPKSRRYITPQRAQQIIASVRGDYRKVGVFVNGSEDDLLTTAALVSLDILQLHGERSIAPRTDRYRIWRSLSGSFQVPVEEAAIEAYLLDAATPYFGGSGQQFPWIRAAGFPHRCLIAGGLDAGNVAEAIETVHPWGVDACSRLEAAPGKKDAAKVRDFIHAAWKANQSRPSPVNSLSREFGSL